MMSTGYRVFFIRNEEIIKISQKSYNALFEKSPQPMPKYSGQTVISVMVVYELESRRPSQILRIDTRKIRFDGHGFPDPDYEAENWKLAVEKMSAMVSDAESKPGQQPPTSEPGTQLTVIDASQRFRQKQWDQRHPELSGPLLQNILEKLFGKS